MDKVMDMDAELKVLVVGAGVAGMQSSLLLAELGYRVYLIDKSPATGGILPQLDHQFPNDHCGMCRMLPNSHEDACGQICLKRGLFHENITVLANTELVSVTGNPGKFHATLAKAPEYIDPLKCTGCGECVPVCLVTVPNAFDGGIGTRKAVFLPVPNPATHVYAIDPNTCTRCGACVAVCRSDAITLDAKPQQIELDQVAGIIMAGGVPLYDPSPLDVLGYGVLPEVVTATAFERMLSGTGPVQGKSVRFSDQRPIKKIAWIQCVGSRNVMIGAESCSSACCMFSIKEARLAKEKWGDDVETAIFYMDMRTYGRDFQRYRDNAEQEQGIRLIRCRIHSIESDEAGALAIGYVNPKGAYVSELFDLVVLATGKKPSYSPPNFGIKDGLLVVDSAKGLMDISESVISATAVAGKFARQFAKSETARKPEATLAGKGFDKLPTFQVILCECFGALTSDLDMPYIRQKLLQIPGVREVSNVSAACVAEGSSEVQERIASGGANRYVIAACNSYKFWHHIRNMSRHAELSPSLVQQIDIHALIHQDQDKIENSEIVLRAIEMTIARMRSLKPMDGVSKRNVQTALVIGGGPSGLSAALSLAENGIEVHLVEKESRVGGNIERITIPETKTRIQQLIAQVENHPNITIHLNTQAIRHEGIAGNFKTTLRHGDTGQTVMRHGAGILATGGKGSRVPASWVEHERIKSQFDFEQWMNSPEFKNQSVHSIAMIQCAGCREEPRNYCSRICCPKTLNIAQSIKSDHPNAEITVFYRDMMTPGESEKQYTEARKKGVLFIPYDPAEKPKIEIESGGDPVIHGWDTILNEPLTLKPDATVLATGVVPNDADDLSRLFGVELTVDGFIREADPKWRPVDTDRGGIFVCGLARTPCDANHAILEGEAAAQRAVNILAKSEVAPRRAMARVRPSLCSLCEMCIPLCPYGARFFNLSEGQIQVDPMLCQGCGACAAICPSSATIFGDYEDDGIMNAIEAAVG